MKSLILQVTTFCEFSLKITEPSQFIVIQDNQSFNDSIESKYQVKQIADGDKIRVMRVRFACIDTTEIPKFNAEKNINNPGDKNQC